MRRRMQLTAPQVRPSYPPGARIAGDYQAEPIAEANGSFRRERIFGHSEAKKPLFRVLCAHCVPDYEDRPFKKRSIRLAADHSFSTCPFLRGIRRKTGHVRLVSFVSSTSCPSGSGGFETSPLPPSLIRRPRIPISFMVFPLPVLRRGEMSRCV